MSNPSWLDTLIQIEADVQKISCSQEDLTNIKVEKKVTPSLPFYNSKKNVQKKDE